MFWSSKPKRFIRALEKEDAQTANSLIESGIDVNAVVEGQTLVYWAVRYKRDDTLSALIRAGADISKETSAGTPLSEAIRSRSLTIAKILIDAGALRHERDAGRSLLMDAIAFKCNDKVFDMLFAAGVDVAASDSDGTPALISALQHKLGHAAVLLVKHGANVNVADEDQTALMIAAERGFFHVVEEMLRAGAKVNQADHLGRTALDYAEMGHPQVSQALRGAGALTLSEMQERALAAAAAADDSQVGAMIDCGLRLEDAMWKALVDGRSDLAVAIIQASRHAGTDQLSRSLHLALKLSASRDVLAALIETGADPKWANDEGEFPLHIAVGQGNSEAIKLLVGSGASVDALDTNGRTALMGALLAGEGEALRTLIRQGARLNVNEFRGKTSQDLLFRMPIPEHADHGQLRAIVEDRRSIRLMLEGAHEALIGSGDAEEATIVGRRRETAGHQAGEPGTLDVHIEGLRNPVLFGRLRHLKAILEALETEPDRVATQHLRKLADIRRSEDYSVIGLFGSWIDGGEAFLPGEGFFQLHYALDLAEWQLEQRAD